MTPGDKSISELETPIDGARKINQNLQSVKQIFLKVKSNAGIHDIDHILKSQCEVEYQATLTLAAATIYTGLQIDMSAWLPLIAQEIDWSEESHETGIASTISNIDQ